VSTTKEEAATAPSTGTAEVTLRKPDGGRTRCWGIPTVRDRVVQASTLRTLLERSSTVISSDLSYGYRPGRSAPQAIRKRNWFIRRYSVQWSRCDMGLSKMLRHAGPWNLMPAPVPALR